LNWGQGRNEVRWRPGQEASLALPCSNEPEVFRKQMYSIQENTKIIYNYQIMIFSRSLANLLNTVFTYQARKKHDCKAT